MSILQYLITNHPRLLRFALSLPGVEALVAKIKINQYANLTKPRPRPHSLAASYTSWQSLTDKEFTGRHLPEDEKARNYPEIDRVAELWRRENGQEIPSSDTSLLFSFFAQWFTDSFLRTNIWDTRKNISNHEIDFCQLYGSDASKTEILRAKSGGKLTYQMIDGEMFPPFLFDPEKTRHDHWVFAKAEYEAMHPLQRLKFIFPKSEDAEDRLKYMFLTGVEHGNAHIGYTVLNIIALREHNRICDELAATHPHWDDERLFQTARLISMVIWLKVVLGDYVGHIASFDLRFLPKPGFAERQRWYRSNWISIEFDLLYRWHSMVPEKLHVQDQALDENEYRSNPFRIIEIGVENLIEAASRQNAGRIGLKNTPSLFFERIGVNGDQPSIQSRTIQMARDAKLRPYNDYRRAFGLKPLKDFDALTDDRALAHELETLYGHIDNLEWIVGIYAEKHAPNLMMGDLMLNMVAYDAFTHALTNPLFSENIYGEESFTKIGLEIINQSHGIQDIVDRNVNPAKRPLASFKSVENVPGTHGLPIFGKIKAVAELAFFDGWTRFFEKRMKKYNSPVFKANFIEPVIVILDPEGFEPFIHWNGRLKKEWRFGFVSPPKSLTGGARPLVFQNNGDHEKHKTIALDLIQSRAKDFTPVFDRLFEDYATKWVAMEQVPMTEELEKFAMDFAFGWMFDIKINTDDARLIYNNIFAHHFQQITKWNPRSNYSRSIIAYTELVKMVRVSDGMASMRARAQNFGEMDQDELCHQMIFLTGMNIYLGLQNLSKSLLAELAINPDERAKILKARKNSKKRSQHIKAFVKETLRLHPPVFFLFGRANQDFVLHSQRGNFQIKKNDQLVAVVPFAQRQCARASDPDIFDPSRYDREDAPELVWSHGLHDAPPSADAHNCAGKDFALRFAERLVEKLVEEYEWSFVETPEWDEKRYGLNVAAPKGPLKTKSFRKITR